MSAIGLKRGLALGEEAAFLWVSRGGVARSSVVTFDVLARLDERLSRLVYKLSERPVLAERFLDHDFAPFRSGLAFVTAIVALRGGVVQAFEELLTRMESDQELLPALASALSWLEYGEVRAHVERLLTAPSPALLQLGVMAAVAHRVDPRIALDRALDTKVPSVRASALEAVGRLAVQRLRPRLLTALEDEDSACRFWAAWSAVRLGDRAGIPVLGRFAAQCGAFAKPACEMALRALDMDQAIRAHQRLLSMTGNQRLAVVAAGIIGEPTLASWLLDAMESPPLARPAGAAFCLMTGCDLRRDDLDSERPPAEAASESASEGASDSDDTAGKPSSNADDDSLDDEIDSDRAWPDTARVRQWWNGHRLAFATRSRYLAGLPIRSADMFQVLRTGNQQQRAAAALELALLHPDAPLMDVTAPAHRQGETSPQVA